MALPSRSFLLVSAALLFLFATVAAATPLQGRVVAVADGDTLTVLDASRQQHRVRLAELDAPESGQAFGRRSGQLLSQLCHGKQVVVRDTSSDRYGRVVGTVFCDGINANAEMVRQGLAWVYVQYARPGSELFALERQAREARIGLWSDPHPVEPWLWRRGQRTSSAAAPVSGRTMPASVRGNRSSGIYHRSDCPDFHSIAERNRVSFPSEEAASAAGYRPARNCPSR